jgi:hypothetical protein
VGVIDSILNTLGLNDKDDQEIGSLEGDAVTWKPRALQRGSRIQINYQGLLKNCGAHEVFLHYGFDNWSKDVNTVRMDRSETGEFVKDIQIEGDREINFCFKDALENWDNNSGRNYTLPLKDTF